MTSSKGVICKHFALNSTARAPAVQAAARVGSAIFESQRACANKAVACTAADGIYLFT